ncbi:MAG: glycosyltransferase family A protein [Prevotella sp.]|nr:glycosyltransferase family A protein [Prevotella sp.]
METITVIVPVYNSENTILRCLDSIMTQSFQDFELIVINDGSTDNTKNIIIDFAKNNRLFRYYEKKNGGVSSARNLGLCKAKGKYICFVDSDDYLEPNYLKVLYEAMVDNCVEISMCEKYSPCNHSIQQTVLFRNNGEIITSILNNKAANAALWNKLFKKEIIGDLLFDETVYLGEDTLFCIEYTKHCHKGVLVRQGLYHYDEPNYSKKYWNDDIYFERFLTLISSREKMLQEIETIGDEAYKVIVNSLYESIFLSYYLAKSHNKKEEKKQLCCRLRMVMKKYPIKIKDQDRPITWKIMTYNPIVFDLYCFIHKKYNALLRRIVKE